MAELTPMMKQYVEIKKQSQDCILFFRLGDFYEMFFEDAVIASKELELVLTGKDCGLEERAPMCGIPYHAAQNYIAKLVNKGYKVAICEQVEDPAMAKGIVKRDIVKIYTRGTVNEDNMLDMRKNNFLMSVFVCGQVYGVAIADVSTGDFYCTSIAFGNTKNKLLDEIAKFAPAELIINQPADWIRERLDLYVSVLPTEAFERQTAEERIAALYGTELLKDREYDISIQAAGALLYYLEQTQKMNLKHIQTIDFYKIEEFMMLDMNSRRNLELVETMRDRNRKGTLLWVLDQTKTAMGGRKLRKWVEQPLIRQDDINDRLNAVEEFFNSYILRAELRELLENVYDLERLCGKVAMGNATPRDFISLKRSLGQIPYIKELLGRCQAKNIDGCQSHLHTLDDVYQLLDAAIAEDAPMNTKDGGFIKAGYHADVDRYRAAKTDGKGWLAQLEAREKEATGIKTLKIGYNKVFGYYLEVSNSFKDMVPDTYIRKQTLTNGERFITQELKEFEGAILDADTNLQSLEMRLFQEVREFVTTKLPRLKETANAVAELDALAAMAEVAEREHYIKPVVDDSDAIDIQDGRHPVVEKMLKDDSFVPNDVHLDTKENRVLVITGPNMAGKSTYMRQVALIVLMAQIGSFVPAASAHIGICDQIFTRVGASDDLASGQSTFMVEMSEVSHILKNATNRSLLILDEIGRGTSTFDGLSIAWAVVEHVSNAQVLGARTMFATHYHELTELEGKLEGVKNYCVDVKKKGEDIIFLRKIIRGGADGSYGVQVARLAGLPQSVLDRAAEILRQLENSDLAKKEAKILKAKKQAEGQLDILSYVSNTVMQDEIIEELRSLDMQTVTPIEALNKLYELSQKAKKR